MDNGIFQGSTGLTGITLPDTISYISSSAFYHCSNLSRVVIPDGMTQIWMEAFKYCPSLISIVIPNTVHIIEEYAFDDNAALTDITIPSSMLNEITRYLNDETVYNLKINDQNPDKGKSRILPIPIKLILIYLNAQV